MGIEIIWSAKAVQSFEETIENILFYWTEREVRIFTKKVSEILTLLKSNPQLFAVSKSKKYHHKVVINYHISMYYRFEPRKNKIQIQLFRANKQKPI